MNAAGVRQLVLVVMVRGRVHRATRVSYVAQGVGADVKQNVLLVLQEAVLTLLILLFVEVKQHVRWGIVKLALALGLEPARLPLVQLLHLLVVQAGNLAHKLLNVPPLAGVTALLVSISAVVLLREWDHVK
jgi:hypothetical protein